MKKALLIGINYTSTPDVQLNGCIDDVVNMRNTLIDAYDYETANITLLRDDELRAAYQPTRDNIINNLRSLAAQSGNLSEIWIHYSGHGSQIRDTNGDEAGGYDSMIIPCDFQRRGFILDDELLTIIQSIKCKAMLMFDSCNSGTVCDLPWSFEYHCSRKESGFTDLIRTRVDLCDLSNSNIFVISGCKDDQKSMDTFSADYKEPMGAFTNALISCIKNGDSSIMLLYKNSCERLLEQGYKQTPILSTTKPEPKYYIR